MFVLTRFYCIYYRIEVQYNFVRYVSHAPRQFLAIKCYCGSPDDRVYVWLIVRSPGTSEHRAEVPEGRVMSHLN